MTEHDNETQSARAVSDDVTTVVPDLTPTAANGSGLAWSDTDVLDDDLGGHRSWRAALGRAAIVLAVATVIAAGAAAFVHIHARHVAAPAAPRPKPVPAAPPLDGVYRVDIDNAHATYKANIPVPPDPSAAPTHYDWGFRSACTADGCVATRTDMASAVETDVLRFVDGRWTDATPARQEAPCSRLDGAAASQTTESTWQLTPSRDGSLTGTVTNTVMTNECGDQGDVAIFPVTLTRVGPLPPGAAVADPLRVP